MGFQSCGYNVQKMSNILGVSESAVKNAMAQSLQGGFARIWRYTTEKTKSGKELAKVEMSTSRKTLNDTYETNFQCKYVTFIGSAFKKLLQMQVPESGVSVQITSCEVTNSYNKEKQREYTNYTVYDFEIPDSGNRQSGGRSSNSRPNKGYNNYSAQMPQEPPIPDDEDEELPF